MGVAQLSVFLTVKGAILKDDYECPQPGDDTFCYLLFGNTELHLCARNVG